MNPPLFSIATPTRNALPKLRRCVGSIRGQVGVTWEHLVQDACSSDGSVRFLAAEASTDACLKPRSEADSGMYDAINRAWQRSQGTLLSWLNADEQYLPGTLQRVACYMAANPSVDVMFADYLAVDDRGLAVAVRREIPFRRFYVVNSFLNLQSCTMFFRRELFERGWLTFDSRYRYAADKDLVLCLHERGARFAHLPEVLSMFGVDGANLSTHAKMAEEAEAVRREHGALAWRPLRALALGARRTERLLRGAYRRSDIRYAWASDEVPHYVHYRSQRAGGRYSLADVDGSAEISPVTHPGAAPAGRIDR